MIHRLLSPQVLLHPALLPWLGRVCTDLKFPAGTAEFIAGLCGQEHTQVLLGIEDARPVALLVSQLPTPLMLQPAIALGHNEGSKAIGAEMMREAARWIHAAGFRHFYAVNRSGRSDAAYERGLRPHGKVIERATTLLVELREEEEQNEVQSAGDVLGVRAA